MTGRLAGVALAACSAAACAGEAAPPVVELCDAGDHAFVQRATIAVLGRRPLDRDEAAAYVEVVQMRGKRGVVEALARQPAYLARWSDYLMDHLRVTRIGDRERGAMDACYGVALHQTPRAELARAVRAADPRSAIGAEPFTLRDLMASSLVADDLSPVFRAHPFVMVDFPIFSANANRIDAELLRRDDLGTTFDSAFLHRDLLCLGCHNSEFSVTYSDQPSVNRHWPLTGSPERALYGDAGFADARRVHAVFRVDGVRHGPVRPWGWDEACGGFEPDVPPDVAGVAAAFGAITGDRATVFDLEASLRRGFDALATEGLGALADGSIPDPDRALAYLVAAAIVDGVWNEVMGARLTIANYFPRNRDQRDLLAGLTERFIASDYSLLALLGDIVETPYFAALPPSAGCGGTPYSLPGVLDPWAIADDDPARRANGPGDATAALPARVMLSAAYAALAWSAPEARAFPGDAGDELALQRGIGVPLKASERGFRGLDFQALLEWEHSIAGCARRGERDFIDALLAHAAESDAAVAEVVLALKDRLIGEPWLDDDAEIAALEDIFGAPLSAPVAATAAPEAALREVCAALLASPQFLLDGPSAARLDATY